MLKSIDALETSLLTLFSLFASKLSRHSLPTHRHVLRRGSAFGLDCIASYGARDWSGDVEDLTIDIYIFSTRDETHRVKVVEHGSWPCSVNDRTIYFHRRGQD